MLTSEILNAVFAAQEGNPKASQLLYGLVENQDADNYTPEELVNKLTYSCDLLLSLVNLSESVPNDFLITFLQKSTTTVTKEKYSEFINLLRFYGYTLLVKFVENNWQIAPKPLKSKCKLHIQSLFSNYRVDNGNADISNSSNTMNNIGVMNSNNFIEENRNSPTVKGVNSINTVLSEYSLLVNQKVSQYISTIAIREWPTEWNELIPSIISSLNRLFISFESDSKNNLRNENELFNENNQLINELIVFWGLIVEISAEIRECLDVTLLHKRRIQISNLIKSYVYDIFITIHRAIVLGIATKPQLSKLILSIFRNLSSILDGFIFVTFDVDVFLLNNLNSDNASDVVQTLSNLCLDLSHKRIKHLNTIPEFDLSNEQLYITKLERFLKNLVIISQKLFIQLAVDQSIDQSQVNLTQSQVLLNQSQVTVNVLQMCQGFRNLMEKNSNYILENVNAEVIKLVFDYIMCRLIMHPSVEVSTCSLNASSLLLRRISSIKLKKGENISQKLSWLDHKKFLLILFIRSLKLGNPIINPIITQYNLYTRLPILDPIIHNITSQQTNMGDTDNGISSMREWIRLLTEYGMVDDEISVGQMKSFEARFAALRSSILHCCSLLAIVSPEYMRELISIVGELLSRFCGELEQDCIGHCCNYRKNEKILNYTCDKYILFDGILFILESIIFRLRSNTIDLNNNSHTNGNGNGVNWLSVDLYKNLTINLTPYNSGDWLVMCNMLIMKLMSLELCKSHKYMLDIRRLDCLSTLSILFLYNGQYIGVVIEFVVNKILFELHQNISNLNKCALQCLVVFCKNCKHLLVPFIDVIVSKIHHCLLVVTNDNSKDLLIESLISLITLSNNGVDTHNSVTNNLVANNSVANNLLTNNSVNISPNGSPVNNQLTNGSVNGSSVNMMIWNIMSNYVNELRLVYEKVCVNGVNSENLYKYLFDDLDNDANRKHLHRIINILYSIIKKINITNTINGGIANGTNNTQPNSTGMNGDENNTVGVLEELYRMVLDILMSFVNFWKFDFFDKNIVRKTILSPGKDEWLSLQGYNEALANEDNLELIVETVFPIPDTQNKNTIRSIRRYIYILRQSTLKLLGAIIQHYSNCSSSIQLDEKFDEYVIGIIEWIPVFYLYQIIKHTLSPCILNLKQINIIITKLQQRINHEFLSLRLFKSHNSQTHNSNVDGVEEKIIQLYYLKVYACIDCSNEILSLILFLIKSLPNTNPVTNNSTVPFNNTPNSVGVNSGLMEEERLRSILLCLSSSLVWPHGRIVSESLRILRIYAKIAPQLDTQLHSKYLYQLILYLNKQILLPREFNPIEIGGGNSNGYDSVKEFVNTICCLYESLVKCFPNTKIIQDEEVNLNELVSSEHIFETLKLFTPFFGEQDCIIFVKYILMQKSIDSRSLMRNRINQILKINNYDFAKQFNCSILEPKPTTNEEEEDILGNDILYLLFE